MNNINYSKTFFLKSVAKVSDMNIEHGVEIAFIGYSNSGKSSVINCLTNQKKLARCSKTPGCTQFINFFQVQTDFRLVDLPGYGYSKVPILIKKKCLKITHNYLQHNKCLKGLILLMDIRNPLKIFDQNIIKTALNYKMPILLLLTKCDKLTASDQKIQFQKVHKKLRKISNKIPLQLFSSLKKIGVEKLKFELNLWYKKNCLK